MSLSKCCCELVHNFAFVLDLFEICTKFSFFLYWQTFRFFNVLATADKPIEKEVQQIIKKKQKFERMVVTKEEALNMFADNPFKVKILSTKVPDGSRTTVYRCGDLIDLCRGPHLSHTGKVKAFAAAKHSAAYWLGDSENDSLQRVYGITFPDKKQLKVWQEMMEKVGSILWLYTVREMQRPLEFRGGKT